RTGSRSRGAGLHRAWRHFAPRQEGCPSHACRRTAVRFGLVGSSWSRPCPLGVAPVYARAMQDRVKIHPALTVDAQTCAFSAGGSMARPDGTALLIVDMINRFDFPGGAPLARTAWRIAPALAALRARFDEAGAPVVYVNDNFTHWLGEFRDLVAQCVDAGGTPARIAGLLQPGPEHYYILKPKHSAFLATALPVLLAKLGVRRVLLAGMALESCVLATAIDANAREYDVAVLRDGVAGRPRLRASTFKVLEGAGIARTIETRNAVAWGARGTQ